jgi:hypothetical protein
MVPARRRFGRRVTLAKVEVRRGLLLAEWPAQKAGNGLIIGWQQQWMEWFAVRQGAGLLVQMGSRADHMAQWTLHQPCSE